MKTLISPKINNIFKLVINIGIYVAFLLIMIVCISEKKNLHCDEVYTYVMTNNTSTEHITVAPNAMHIYENPENVWLDTMTVQNGQSFNFVNVWKKQAADNHPPFYYSLVHSISSFFPNQYSKWFAGIVNIIMGMLILVFSRKIVRLLSSPQEQPLSVFTVSCCLIFSSGFLSALTFFRMYATAMFFVILISYIFLSNLECRNKKFYISLYITSVLGALTHYYFIVYLFFICLMFFIILIRKKEWKDLFTFVGIMLAAGISTIAIFPPMLNHVFGNTLRGQQSMEQLTTFSWDMLIYKLKSSYDIVNVQLFSRTFSALIILCLLAAIINVIRHYHKKEYQEEPTQDISPFCFEKWLLLWIPCIAYFIFISKIAVFITDRYFHLIYAMLIILVVTALCLSISKLLGSKIAFVLLFCVLLFTTFRDFGNNWYYLYRSTQPFLDLAATHSDKDCLFIYDKIYEIDPSFYEVRNYNRVVFVPMGCLGEINELTLNTDNGLIVSFSNTCDFNLIQKEIQETWDKLDTYELLGNHSFSTTYFFQ